MHGRKDRSRCELRRPPPRVPPRSLFEAWVRAALGNPRRAGVASGGGGRGAQPKLNARYRHKDKPTNVLSFGGAGPSPDGRNYLGELVICAPGWWPARPGMRPNRGEAHWAHLTVHGVLHLLGFDHERPAEARKMAAKEVQILDRLGFSDPYA